ncbi:MAG TPA: hypothetical protein VD999_04555 [Vitreimonas sp.]|nr:hypothetical protein [Vitreimonas sp.]
MSERISLKVVKYWLVQQERFNSPAAATKAIEVLMEKYHSAETPYFEFDYQAQDWYVTQVGLEFLAQARDLSEKSQVVVAAMLKLAGTPEIVKSDKSPEDGQESLESSLASIPSVLEAAALLKAESQLPVAATRRLLNMLFNVNKDIEMMDKVKQLSDTDVESIARYWTWLMTEATQLTKPLKFDERTIPVLVGLYGTAQPRPLTILGNELNPPANPNAVRQINQTTLRRLLSPALLLPVKEFITRSGH